MDKPADKNKDKIISNKIILDDLNSIDFKKFEKKSSFFKKIFFIIVALALLILISTYLLTGYIDNIILGLVESYKVKDNIVRINSTNKLIFVNDTYPELLNIFNIDEEKEFKVCLKGYTDNGDYYVNSFYIPKTYLQKSNMVIADPCSDDTIVDLHSHPLKHCLPSQQDFISFKLFKDRNENAIMAVMCEKGRFNFYN